MYWLQDAVSPFCWTYFVVLVIFGSFFAVNLALAVLYLHFVKSAENDADDAPKNTADSTL